MFTLCATLLLGVLSVGHSSSLGCEDLVRPVDQLDPEPILGGWAFVAAGLNNTIHEMKFKSRDSASFFFVNRTSGLHLTRTVRFQGGCQTTDSGLTLEGSSLIYTQSNLTLSILRTSCADCLVIHSHKKSNNHQHVYLFSRRRDLKKDEMEEFESQVKCFNIPLMVWADPTKELCPDEI